MGSCTCFYDGKFEPRQIDFVAIGRGPSRGSCDCQARCCSAWKSDHCALVFRCFAARTPAPQFLPNIECSFKTKPVGWRLLDHTFARKVEDQRGIEARLGAEFSLDDAHF
eukprot:240475-Pyramimonas_sp.AAC.1